MRAFFIGLASFAVVAVIAGLTLDWAQQPTTEQSLRLGSVHLEDRS